MREKGVDISGQRSKGLQEVDPSTCDLLVTLCALEECPRVPIAEHRHWQMPNPAGQGPETVRLIRDEIERKVVDLVRELREKAI